MKKTLGLDDIAGMEELEKELVKDEDFSAGVTAQQQNYKSNRSLKSIWKNWVPGNELPWSVKARLKSQLRLQNL